MKISSVSGLNFKNSLNNPKKCVGSDVKHVSEAEKVRQHMEKSGLNSKPVKIGAIAGFCLGTGISLLKRKSLPCFLFEAACLSGLGASIGKILFHLNKKFGAQQN